MLNVMRMWTDKHYLFARTRLYFVNEAVSYQSSLDHQTNVWLSVLDGIYFRLSIPFDEKLLKILFFLNRQTLLLHHSMAAIVSLFP